MGYCPLPNATFELLTGQEHLEQFSRLHGVPEAKTVQVTCCPFLPWGLWIPALAGSSWPHLQPRPTPSLVSGPQPALSQVLHSQRPPCFLLLPKPPLPLLSGLWLHPFSPWLHLWLRAAFLPLGQVPLFTRCGPAPRCQPHPVLILALPPLFTSTPPLPQHLHSCLLSDLTPCERSRPLPVLPPPGPTPTLVP